MRSSITPQRSTLLTLLVMAVLLSVTSVLNAVHAPAAHAVMKYERMTFDATSGCGLLPCNPGAQTDRAFRAARTDAYREMRQFQRDAGYICVVRSEDESIDAYPGSSSPGYRWILNAVCSKRSDIGTKLGVQPISGPEESGVRIIISAAELRTIATYGRTAATTLAAVVCSQIPDDLSELRAICAGGGSVLADWLTKGAQAAGDRGCRGIIEVTTKPRLTRYYSCPM